MKLHIRLPSDTGPNPYDSATPINSHPSKDWQIAGRGFEWWAGIIVLGIVFGLMAYFKALP